MLDQPISSELLEPKPAPLPFRSAVRFQNVRFRYAPDLPWVLDGFDLTIAKGSRIGFVGTTGSGKSTALDLLMGLLVPNEGAILVDDQPLAGGRIRAWQQTIAHVPQNIFLADSTLAENIALGVPPSEIEMQRVRIAARQAHIAEFIESLPGGYDGRVGERGVRLSGGQRQRIGIARALYKQATVLVLDEATSALDSATEQSVMDCDRRPGSHADRIHHRASHHDGPPMRQHRGTRIWQGSGPGLISATGRFQPELSAHCRCRNTQSIGV